MGASTPTNPHNNNNPHNNTRHKMTIEYEEHDDIDSTPPQHPNNNNNNNNNRNHREKHYNDSAISSFNKARKSITFSPKCGDEQRSQHEQQQQQQLSRRKRNNSTSMHADDMENESLFFVVDQCKLDDLYDWEEGEGRKLLNSGGSTGRGDGGSNGQKVRTGTLVTCNEKKIALFRFGSVLYAIDERCPHMGGPLHLGNLETIGEARLLCVACPWHKWKIELVTGKLRMPAGRGVCNQVYPTQILSDGTIKIGFDEIAQDYFSGEYDF